MIPPASILALLFITASCASVPYETNYNPAVLGHEDYVRPIHYLASAYARRHSVGRFESAAVQEATYFWHLVQVLRVFYVGALVLNTKRADSPYWKINVKAMSKSSPFSETQVYFAPCLFPRLHAPPLSTLVMLPSVIPDVQNVKALNRLVGPPPAALPFPASLNFHPKHALNTTEWPFSAFVKMCISKAMHASGCINLSVEYVVRLLQEFFPKARPYLIYAHPGSVFRWLKEPFEHFTSDALLDADIPYESEPPYKGILLVAYPPKYALGLDGQTEKAVIGLALRLSDDCPNISTDVYDRMCDAVLRRGPVSYSDVIQRYTRMQIKIKPMTREEIVAIKSAGDGQQRCRIL